MTDLCGGICNAVAAEKGEGGNMMSRKRWHTEQDLCLEDIASGGKTPLFGTFIYFSKMIEMKLRPPLQQCLLQGPQSSSRNPEITDLLCTTEAQGRNNQKREWRRLILYNVNLLLFYHLLFI